ncbi:hypothetical protein CWI39_1364p0010, partial [Hamiltosporidium magnivora]
MIVLNKFGLEIIGYSNSNFKQSEFIYESQLYIEEEDEFCKSEEKYVMNLSVKGVIMRAEMHEEPTPPLKEEKREEDGAKNFKPKNKAPFISQGGNTLEEPT